MIKLLTLLNEITIDTFPKLTKGKIYELFFHDKGGWIPYSYQGEFWDNNMLFYNFINEYTGNLRNESEISLRDRWNKKEFRVYKKN